LTLGPAKFDRDILSLDEADFIQASAKPGHETLISIRRRRTEKSDHRHRRLLCVRTQRPCSRTAEQGEEIAPPHELPSDAKIHNP
jgi:hypothetical protein